MKAVQQNIRILVIIILADRALCQDGFSDHDILRYQQMANEGQIEAITSYSTNIIQRDPNSQSISSVNVQYHMTDDKDDYNRADRTRSRKVYRIRNPFQYKENDQQNESTDPQDSGPAASNQYATMQYSLPPEEFLQQMRAGNQYYQQQQQQQQTTPNPNLGYTATPQPQYQYSTIASDNYDNANQQTNQIPQLEPKSHTQYITNTAYQFNPQNTFPFDSLQSTPSPVTPYLSTALPNSQYVGTASNYVSSSSPIYLSSPPQQPNLQYVSSPYPIQTGSQDYSGNRVTTTIGSQINYDNIDQNKQLQIDHYDNSANGIRYPINVQQQYQNDYGSSTAPPTTYSDTRDLWQNSLNTGVNALSKSLQEVQLTQYQNYPYSQQEVRADSTSDSNSDTHRISGMAAANNVYLNFAQPDYQTLNNVKGRTRDTEQETGQPDYYSNGEYGWKLDRKPQFSNDLYTIANSGNYQRYQPAALQSGSGEAVSQMTFHIDTSKPHNNDQVSKSASENEAQEFAKAAAKAHEYMKQQQSLYGNNYMSNYNNNLSASLNTNSFYGNIDRHKNTFSDISTPGPYLYSSQPDLITASPYYFNTRENSVDNKPKQPFDHAKALKNIVPIDVSNVVSNSESQLKNVGGLDGNRYTIQNYGKDQLIQNQQQYRHVSDSYYKDKNAIYGVNIKAKPEEYTDNVRQFDSNNPYYLKQQQTQEPAYNQGAFSAAPLRINYYTQASTSFPDNIHSSANLQQQGKQRPQIQLPSDINSILKLNDLPYQLTQNLSPDSLRFHNSEFDRGNVPAPLPVRINQDVGSHQIDVTSNILNKLLLNKQPVLSVNRPDFDSQPSSALSTINGFKVANPFNVDLKLVAEILKGKTSDNTNIMSQRDQLNKQPLRLDVSQLQFLLKNENIGNLAPTNDGISVPNPFLDIYSSGRYPYQGVKYSRSQEEEEETIVPIADASDNHPIGAVAEQNDPSQEREEISDDTAEEDESMALNYEEERPKKSFKVGHKMVGDRSRHPNSLIMGRHQYPRKYPKMNVDEPYPLLKPPPPRLMRGRGSHIRPEKYSRRRRVNKPRHYRQFKTEPLFESENEGENVENSVPTLLRPPPPVAEAKSDVIENSS